MYALIGAHLAQLILNWHNDAFILRQRLNFFGTTAKPPQVVASSNYFVRTIRLAIAVIILATTLNFEWCSKEDTICDTDISHVTHIYGAVFGVLSGCIFLRARRCKIPIRIAQNTLLVIIYGLAALWIFGNFWKKREEEWCPWIEYERKCQDLCYRKNFTESAGLCKNVSFTICELPLIIPKI